MEGLFVANHCLKTILVVCSKALHHHFLEKARKYAVPRTAAVKTAWRWIFLD